MSVGSARPSLIHINKIRSLLCSMPPSSDHEKTIPVKRFEVAGPNSLTKEESPPCTTTVIV